MAGMLGGNGVRGRRGARTIVITGGSSGIGRATALEFGRRGWNVALIARGERALRATRAEVEAEGGRALVLPLDVANAAAVEDAAHRVVRKFGGIDAWVNGAAVSAYSPLHEMTSEEIRRIVEINLLGSIHGIRAALRHMRPRNRGHVVQIGSALSQRAFPLQSVYSGTKYGIRGVLDAVNAELRHDRSRVRTTIVQPPSTNTPFFEHALNRMPKKAVPPPPVYQPEVIARAIVQAVETRPRELWVGGATTAGAVGHVLAPGMMDWLSGRIGYRSQQSREPRGRHERNNLYGTADADGGRTHGRFDENALEDGKAIEPFRVRSLLGLAGVAAIAGVTALAMRRRRAASGGRAKRSDDRRDGTSDPAGLGIPVGEPPANYAPGSPASAAPL